jgi:hypothetical protein
MFAKENNRLLQTQGSLASDPGAIERLVKHALGEVILACIAQINDQSFNGR